MTKWFSSLKLVIKACPSACYATTTCELDRQYKNIITSIKKLISEKHIVLPQTDLHQSSEGCLVYIVVHRACMWFVWSEKTDLCLFD